MNDQPPHTHIGHNRGPAFDAEKAEGFATLANDLADAAGEWKETGAISDETQAEKANDFLAAARSLFKEVEDQRKSDKEPHLDAGREVDAKYSSIKKIIEKSAEMVKPLLATYVAEKERQEAARRAEEQRKAKEEAEAAERARIEAERRNDAAGMVEAEEAEKAAQEAAAEAEKPKKARVGSATGRAKTTSLRTVYSAEIESINQALLHYRDHDDVAEVLTRLANAELRASKDKDITIPGFKITKRKTL